MQEHILLKGKTRKGKTRIGTHGPEWVIDDIRQSLRALHVPGDAFLLIRSTDGKDDWRWIHLLEDPDFEILRRWYEEGDVV